MDSCCNRSARWYNHPRFYDIAFGWDPSVEVDFLARALQRFTRREVRRVLEPFVGTGRIAVELARRGYVVSGMDISAPAIDFARQKARDAGVQVQLAVGDACSWAPSEPVDAVVTLIDSFRHLAAAEQAAAA